MTAVEYVRYQVLDPDGNVRDRFVRGNLALAQLSAEQLGIGARVNGIDADDHSHPLLIVRDI